MSYVLKLLSFWDDGGRKKYKPEDCCEKNERVKKILLFKLDY